WKREQESILRSFLIGIAWCMGTWFSHAQTVADIAHATPSGVFVAAGKMFAKNHVYRVLRTEGNQETKLVGEFKGPSDRSDFEKNLAKYLRLLPKLDPISPAEKDLLWGHYLTHESVDSLFFEHMAFTYLGLGLAYLDTTAVIGKNYKYTVEKVQDGASEMLYQNTSAA